MTHLNDPSGTNVPKDPAVYLDHVGIFARNANQASAAMEKLGFIQTPFARHVNHLDDGSAVASGTGNRCVMFREGYLEILTATGEDTPLARQFNTALGRYEGLHLIAFGIENADCVHERLTRSGLSPLPAVHLHRTIPTETGSAEGSFDVIRFVPDAMPEGRIQLVAHKTPNLVWQSRWLTHPNGAQALTGILVAVDSVQETTDRLARVSAADAIDGTAGGKDLPLARGLASVVDADRLERMLPIRQAPEPPFMAAMSVSVADLSETSAVLTHLNIDYRRESHRLCVSSSDALGMTVVFHEPDEAPW